MPVMKEFGSKTHIVTLLDLEVSSRLGTLIAKLPVRSVLLTVENMAISCNLFKYPTRLLRMGRQQGQLCPTNICGTGLSSSWLFAIAMSINHLCAVILSVFRCRKSQCWKWIEPEHRSLLFLWELSKQLLTNKCLHHHRGRSWYGSSGTLD